MNFLHSLRHLKFRPSLKSLLIVGLALSFNVAAEVELDDDNDMVVEPHLALPVTDNLEALGSAAQRASVPILIMYSSEECQWCARLESEVLGPMRLSGADPKRVIVRKVMMDEYEDLRDFNGNKNNAEYYAIQQGVDVVPTVALVDQYGKELVPKIEGYQTPGIYEKFLEQAIDVSHLLLQSR